MSRYTSLCLVLLVTVGFVGAFLDNKLLVFLMDGFKWDYLDLGDYPGFDRFIANGVRAKYVVPDFPTTSYPNYYSIMTGVHTETHGMISNFMYSTLHNESFLIGTNPEQYNAHWWEDAEPLWVTAEKKGLKTAWYRWLGTEVTIHGVNSSHVTKYITTTTLDDLDADIASAISYLKGDVDIVGIYCEIFDSNGHKYGAASDKIQEMLEGTDTRLTQLMDTLESENLTDSVNIMIFSDHGLTNVTELINLSSVVDDLPIDHFLEKCSVSSIFPTEGEGNLELVYSTLKNVSEHIHVYKKDEIPERYHYKNNRRVAPITMVADSGYCFVFVNESFNVVGFHGYDNADEDMRGVFFAKGPDFKKKYVSEGIDIVDIYQLMCKVTGITPVQNAGDWDNVKDMLKTETSAASPLVAGAMTIFMGIVVLFSL